jgi:anaphase-promoting complex subunit 3
MMYGQLKSLILYFLNNFIFEESLFYAERLYADYPNSEETIYLYALCYYRSGEFKSCYSFLLSKNNSLLSYRCKYLFGQACLKCKLFSEGIDVLLPCIEEIKKCGNNNNEFLLSPSKNVSDSTVNDVDIGNFYYLLGLLCRGSNRNAMAVSMFQNAVTFNPFLITAIESICSLQEGSFDVSTVINHQTCSKWLNEKASPNNNNNLFTCLCESYTNTENSASIQNIKDDDICRKFKVFISF